MRNFKEGPVVQILFFLLSIGILYLGFKGLYSTLKLMYFSEVTSGLVIEYESRISKAKWKWNREPEYKPTFQFELSNGELIDVEANSFRKKKKYEIGQQVKVFYDKSNPENANVEGYFEWKDLYVLLIGIVGVLVTATNILSPNN